MKDLFDNSKNLIDRFQAHDGHHGRTFTEEVYEFLEVFLREEDPRFVAIEFVDMIYAGLSMLHWYGVNWDTLEDAIDYVKEKNNKKTAETHVFVDGKIRRIP